MSHPLIIQGGMGAWISNWVLARSVSQLGHMGVVSGTALEVIMVRQLQLGDPGGNIRRSLDQFPVPEIANRIYLDYFIPGGKAVADAFKRIPMHSLTSSRSLMELSVVSNFVEVFLAKEGHDGKVGINYLEKIQLPNLASIYGAMLAGVDYVLMGAGIPREIPGVLDRYINHEDAELRIDVENDTDGESETITFSPQHIIGKLKGALKRPDFLAIIASAVLAISLFRKSTGKVDGFIVEGPSAGGHNAPPRGIMKLNDNGEPIYGEKDEVNLKKVASLGLPFWLAGSYGTPERIAEALDQGATGVQIGTPFAFCDESGLALDLKQQIVAKALSGKVDVYTDPLASPTGFPFKVVMLDETLSTEATYQKRPRICDLGYLRKPYKDAEGKLLYRCPAEPVKDFLRKKGKLEDTVGRKCLCNGLVSNAGMPQQQRNGYLELPFVTSGDDISVIKRFVKDGKTSYSAADVLGTLCPKNETILATH